MMGKHLSTRRNASAKSMREKPARRPGSAALICLMHANTTFHRVGSTSMRWATHAHCLTRLQPRDTVQQPPQATTLSPKHGPSQNIHRTVPRHESDNN